MRFKLLFFSIMLAMLFGSISNSFAQKKYYILFDNFEDQKILGTDTPITNLIDLCYWLPMSTQDITTKFYKYAQRAPFSASTFAERDITEYDVAVFPMGVWAGLDTTIDGIKVMDKIQQMLDAGKSVMIIGSSVLNKAFATTGDQQSRSFLEDFLGIDYIGWLNLFQNNTYVGFTVDGKEDPVAQGYDIILNEQVSEGGGEFRPPMRYYPFVDVFKMKAGSLAIPFYQISLFANDSIDTKKDIYYTGVRNWNKTAKVALWTTNFDIANTWQTLYFNKSLIGGIDWATAEIPRPEQYIQTDNLQYDFNSVGVGDKGYKKISIQNFGREPLQITSIEVVPSETSSVFQISDGGGPVKLEPLEIYSFNVSFAPTDSTTYSEAIDIKSNAINGTLSLQLSGEGGNVNHGAFIQVTDLPVDFGSVAYGQNAEKFISITNSGDVGLSVNTLKFTDDANKFFTFPDVVKTPITVFTKKTYYLKVRFTPLDSNGGDYTGKITLTSDALNQDGPIDIILKAKGLSNSIKSGITLSSTTMDFGNVAVGQSSNYTLTITNKGSEDLIFQSPKLVGGGESLAQFAWVNNTNKIPTLKPGESWDLIMKFTPAASKTYQISLKIISNDAENGNIVVPIQGIGGTTDVVDDNVTPGNLIKLEVSPNPINENGTLNYTYNGTKISNLKIKMIDINGKTAAELFNNNVIIGTQSIQFNTKGLSDGKYIIVAEIDGTVSQIPVIIAR